MSSSRARRLARRLGRSRAAFASSSSSHARARRRLAPPRARRSRVKITSPSSSIAAARAAARRWSSSRVKSMASSRVPPCMIRSSSRARASREGTKRATRAVISSRVARARSSTLDDVARARASTNGVLSGREPSRGGLGQRQWNVRGGTGARVRGRRRTRRRVDGDASDAGGIDAQSRASS